MSSLGCLYVVSVWIHAFGCYAMGSSHLNKLMMKSSPNDISYANPGICVQEAKCEPIENATCFGTALPYTHTSLDLAEDSLSLLEVQDNLGFWQGLRSVPRCWAVVQPLLCAVYMPKCENETLSLPSLEMCKVTRGPCRIVQEKHGWPAFLRCENKKLFPPGCRNPLQELKFNTSSKCIPPLVETDNADSWYESVEGCGLQCRNPLFTEEDHVKIWSFIRVMAPLCFIANLFAVFTFAISWKASSQYPSIIIFYINVCLLFNCIGWLIQFFPGAREEITCRPDGTIRQKSPKSGEHLCNLTFIFTYPPLMAVLVWFVILAYTWYMIFSESDASKDSVKKKVSYINLSALCIPVVLITIVMALQEVEGDSLSGICFVSHANPIIRVFLLLLPVAAATIIGGFFLVAGLYALVKVKLGSQDVTNKQVKKRIRRIIARIGVFSLLSFLFVLLTFACHAFDFYYRSTWEDDLRDYIICLATFSASSSSVVAHTTCMRNNRPSVSMVQIHLMAFFGFSIAMSSWTWTKSSVKSWKQFVFKRFCEPPENEGMAIKRHQLIAKAFQHRNEINQGRFSFSLNSTHDDPIGMNLDVSSIASCEVSTSWAAALPRFLSRRNAMKNFGPIGLKQYSSASDISARRISLDSFHQQNLDSLSLQISEQEYAHVLRHQRRKTRKERERFLRANRIAPWFPGGRRGSDTSIQSSIIAAAVAARATAKVTRATSTGDLDVQMMMMTMQQQQQMLLPPHLARQVVQPISNRLRPQRPLVQNQLPFTHGMADNSHCPHSQAGVGGGAAPAKSGPESGYLTTSLSSRNAAHSPVGPLFSQTYGLASQQLPLGYFAQMLYAGLGAAQYPANYLHMATMAAAAATMNNTGVFPCATRAQLVDVGGQNPGQDQVGTPLIPLHPKVDSASETEYFPIAITDSEFTDGGFRTVLIQEHSQRVASQSSAAGLNGNHHQCQHTCVQLSSSPPHSEAPPPSPVDSETNLEDFTLGIAIPE